MRKLTLLLLLTMPCLLKGQVFRIEFGLSILQHEQNGEIIAQVPGHVPAWYEASTVNRDFKRAGFSVNGYYPLNFGRYSYQFFSYGPQVGITLNKSSLELSQDENYRRLSSGMNIRIPLLFSARAGSTSAVYKGKIGVGLGAGFEFMKVQMADQTGTFLLPVIQASAALSRFTFNINVYPLSIESAYIIDGTELPRLTTKLVEYQILIAIDGIPKRYKNDHAPLKRKGGNRR